MPDQCKRNIKYPSLIVKTAVPVFCIIIIAVIFIAVRPANTDISVDTPSSSEVESEISEKSTPRITILDVFRAGNREDSLVRVSIQANTEGLAVKGYGYKNYTVIQAKVEQSFYGIHASGESVTLVIDLPDLAAFMLESDEMILQIRQGTDVFPLYNEKNEKINTMVYQIDPFLLIFQNDALCVNEWAGIVNEANMGMDMFKLLYTPDHTDIFTEGETKDSVCNKLKAFTQKGTFDPFHYIPPEYKGQ